jgi:phosphate transport system substrate-binding protein
MKKMILAAVAALLLMTPAFAQKLTGAGATFPEPIYSKWFQEYSAANNGIQINYQSIGSGAGIRQLIAGTVDFGATDGPMTDDQIKQYKGGKVLHIPTVLGAVVPVYHIDGLKAELKFSPDVLAEIFLGSITNWNDSRIARDNPGVSLPNKDIFVFHRSDGSGTTFIFTDYLSKVSGEWKNRVGASQSPAWPKGIGGKGNPGVAGLVRQTDGAIGYVELIYALGNNIPYGAVKNAAGVYVKASIQGVSAAAASAKIPADYRVSITNAPGKESYPISSFTWLLIPQHSQDASKGKVLKNFLTWMLDKGESEATSKAYAPLPAAVVARVRATVATIQ